MSDLTTVGKKITKRDAPLKVTGGALYIQDLKIPGMLYGGILYSKHPHAKILKLDTTRAERLPGVAAVITAADVPNNFRFGIMKDNPPLKGGRVRSTRDEIAAVAAVSAEIAAAAL